jgi:hypothetical protein
MYIFTMLYNFFVAKDIWANWQDNREKWNGDKIDNL